MSEHVSFSRMPPKERAAIVESRTALSEGTNTASNYERYFKRALLDLNISGVLYEPYSFFALKNGMRDSHSYTPDFLLSRHRIDGRTVIIDPHGDYLLSVEYFERLRNIRNTYGVFIVLASNVSHEGITANHNVNVLNYVDDYWHVQGSTGAVKRNFSTIAGRMAEGGSATADLIRMAQIAYRKPVAEACQRPNIELAQARR